MAEITAQMVQALREATNVGMMECKKLCMCGWVFSLKFHQND